MKKTTTTTKKYDAYSHFAKYFAATKTVEQLEIEINRCKAKHEKLTKSNLALAKKGISRVNTQKKSESMKAILQNAKEQQAFTEAIEIHTNYPTKAKK